jgi:GNAT superfamily N-acetyltransferase
VKIIMKPLSPELAADFFDFFDNRAFSDNSPEGPCYCTRFQMTKEQENAELSVYGESHDNFMRALKEVAERQIASKSLRGYLAFVDGLAIGWCNANDKANFPPVSGNGARFYAPAEKREKVIACFEIAPEFRGKGVATALLQRVVDDAKDEGYIAVEGYPRKRAERYEWDFTGPARLYEKVGFAAITGQDGNVIMRKDL